MATQMKLKVIFGRKFAWPPGLLERKNNNKVEYFSALFFFIYTNVDNKERARASY